MRLERVGLYAFAAAALDARSAMRDSNDTGRAGERAAARPPLTTTARNALGSTSR
jgi:hypothetical protein